MDREELIALAARCEAATGADREIDRAIALACGAIYEGPSVFPSLPPAWYFPGGRPRPLHHRTSPWEFTASLDAVFALVVEKLPEPFWRVGNDEDNPGDSFRAELMSFDLPKPPIKTRGIAVTPALALCAAFLRAFASQPDASAHGGGDA